MTRFPVEISNNTEHVLSKSLDGGDSCIPLVLLFDDGLCGRCTRSDPSKMRPRMSAPLVEVKGNISGRPLESQRALIGSESMLTSVVVFEPGLPMNESVLVTAPDATAATALDTETALTSAAEAEAALIRVWKAGSVSGRRVGVGAYRGRL